MTFEQVFMALTFISSGIALYFSTRKQKHDNANIDADTIGKLYDLIDKQETRYQELKANLTAEIEELRAEVDILRGEKKVREDTIESMKRENSDLQAQVDKLQAAVKSRDKKISELGRQIVELTARLDAMNGGTL
jgi:chromosome segregation ATPase